MQEAAKSYAWRILGAHLLVLLMVVGAIAIAAEQLYYSTRDQILADAIQRQELLAAETARGIDNYYNSILSNLDLIKRSEEDPTTRPDRPSPRSPRIPLALAPMLWQQLEGRVSSLFSLLRTNDRILSVFPPSRAAEAQEISRQHKEWLKGVNSQAVSPFTRISGAWGHLVCTVLPAPGPAEGRVVLVAVVPIEGVVDGFLNELNRQTSVNAMLIDERGLIMAASRAKAVGANLEWNMDDPVLAQLVRDYVERKEPFRRTVEIQQETMVRGWVVPPRLVTAQPFTVGDKNGKTWVLLITSRLEDVDAMVRGVFHRALLWAILLIAAVTGVLISTSMQMIRARVKIERIRGELLARELTQARRIQLAWLPQQRTWPGPVRVAAVNHPASHISGDFYDWFEMPDGRTVITIGDVTGHGMSAAFLMATAQLLVRTTMLRVGEPGKCLEEVNHQLCSQIFNGQFVTVLIVVLDAGGGVMQMASAGHFAPLLVTEGAVRPVPMETQLVLGVEKDQAYATQSVQLPQIYSLLLYTDGVVEAVSEQREQFGDDRLAAVVAAPFDSPQAMLDAVIAQVRAFTRGRELRDDLTMVAVQGQAVPAEAIISTL